ncbi:MAG TPA: MlaD family protein [Roseimicrobium sp.]|nr:MlaD family protein [Roseimicrobium sp.]
MNKPDDIAETPLEAGCIAQPGRRFAFRHVNEISGVFVLVVIAMLIATVVWTGRSQRWFKSNVPLRIILPEDGAAGIRQGSEIYFLGTLVGSVSDINVDPTGRMEVEASIRRDFFRFVRADSSAVIKKKFGVAGDSFFEITRGEGKPLSEVNASIVCNEQFQSALEAAVEQIRSEAMLVLKKVNGGLDTWTKLGADLGETRLHLDQLTVRLDNMTAGVESGKGTVGKLLTETVLADDAQALLTQAKVTMSGLQGVVSNLNVAVKNIEQGTVRLPEITDAIAGEAKDLPGLVRQAQSSMREMERLINAAQKHWVLRKYVNKTNPPPMHPDSDAPVPTEKPNSAVRPPKAPKR